jgi:RecA-family ATPase
LYIDQERFKGEAKRRFGAVMKSKNLTGNHLDGRLYLKCGTTIRVDLQHSYDAFRRELDKLKPEIIIVDSFTTFHTKEENNRKEIQEVLEKIKLIRNEIGCSVIFIDHENKSVYHNKEEGKDPSAVDLIGSIGKSAAAEFVLTVRHQDAESSMCYHTKSTEGPKIEPFLIKVIDQCDDKSRISVKAY